MRKTVTFPVAYSCEQGNIGLGAIISAPPMNICGVGWGGLYEKLSLSSSAACRSPLLELSKSRSIRNGDWACGCIAREGSSRTSKK